MQTFIEEGKKATRGSRKKRTIHQAVQEEPDRRLSGVLKFPETALEAIHPWRDIIARQGLETGAFDIEFERYLQVPDSVTVAVGLVKDADTGKIREASGQELSERGASYLLNFFKLHDHLGRFLAETPLRFGWIGYQSSFNPQIATNSIPGLMLGVRRWFLFLIQETLGAVPTS